MTRKEPTAIDLPTRKICILGTTPSRSGAPFDDPSWEMWTIGPGGSDTKGMRWERLFEVHGPATWPRSFKHHVSELEKFSPDVPTEFQNHIKALKSLTGAYDKPLPEAFDGYLDLLRKTEPPKVVYTEQPLEGCAANVVYPKQEMFRKYSRMWFTSQISYALALALEENVTDLGIYGIDLESGEEYRSQFVGARHFIDLARLVGVNIHMPKGCGLLRDPNPYPDCYETDQALTLQSKMMMLRELLQRLRGEHEARLLDVGRHEGALGALRDIKSLDGLKEEIARLEMELSKRAAELTNCATSIHRADGELGAFDFMFHRFVIHGDDPNAILSHDPPR